LNLKLKNKYEQQSFVRESYTLHRNYLLHCICHWNPSCFWPWNALSLWVENGLALLPNMY